MAALDRGIIIAEGIRVIERHGVDGLTMRRLGAALGVDPTAVYRHFRDKDDLLRAIGDHLHGDVLSDLPGPSASGAGAWRDLIREVCLRLRAAHLARPDLAALIRTGPPRQDNEFAVTETLVGSLARAGLDPAEVALAYHALIELTIGGAAIDAYLAHESEDDRAAAYASWRRAYASLDERRYPASVAVAEHLYRGSADARFRYALDRLLDGISASVR